MSPEHRPEVGLISETAFAYADFQISTELVRWADERIDFEILPVGIERIAVLC